MSDLNDEQTAAVRCEAQEISVIAGPGSGKTHTLMSRILSREIIAWTNVVVLTFTNTAADEIRDRLKCRGFVPRFVGTLHRFCVQLLRQFGAEIGYRPGVAPTFVTPEQKLEMLVEVAARLKVKTRPSALEKLTDAVVTTGGPLSLVWREFQAAMKQHNMIDYDQMLVAGALILWTAAARAEFKDCELYVDEAQDSSSDDWRIYHLIPASVKYICGDPDQSIYGFRGGDPSLLMDYSDTPGVSLLTLQNNYRSGALICSAATRLIRNNKLRIAKDTVPATATDASIATVTGRDPLDEMTKVYGQLTLAWEEGGGHYTTAVLARTNAIANAMAGFLDARGVAVRIPAKTDRPLDWNRAVALLSVMADPSNDFHAKRWIAMSRTPREAEELALRARLDSKPLSREIAELGSGVQRSYPFQTMERAGISATTLDWLAERVSRIAEIAEILAACHEQDEEKPEDRPVVACCTIHAFKGREADIVAVMGCEEGLLPSLNKTAKIEEERRLMFVAVTRARRILILSRSETRATSWGAPSTPLASRFLEEMR